MVEDLIRRARQRLIFNEALAQCAFAAAVAVGGFALLLAVGTRYMEWWTLAIFAAAGVAIGVFRIFRRAPGTYATAVLLDENARLKDALSTTIYFSQNRSAKSEQFLRLQRAQAEAAAEKVHLDRAAPFVMPKSLYAVAALCVLASVLIALRFGFGHGLDLRPPITQFLLEDQAALDAKHPGASPNGRTPLTREMQSLLSKMGLGPRQDPLSQGDDDTLEKAIQEALENPNDLNSKAEKGTGSGQGGQSKESAESDSPPGDPLDNGEDLSKNQSASEAKPGTKGSRASGKTNSDSQDNLLSRLKEAVSSMLSQADQNAAQKGSKVKNSSDGAQGQQGKGDQQQAESEAEAQGETDADGKNGMQTQGKMNSRTGAQPAQGATGAGSENGSKEIKEAEQLKAMGKISEIIGQRAATVSGETSIEVESGSQKLHTNYSKTSAAHAETDGDVTRDEIPLSMQAYVQQYFAEVRKAKPAKAQPDSK